MHRRASGCFPACVARGPDRRAAPRHAERSVERRRRQIWFQLATSACCPRACRVVLVWPRSRTASSRPRRPHHTLVSGRARRDSSVLLHISWGSRRGLRDRDWRTKDAYAIHVTRHVDCCLGLLLSNATVLVRRKIWRSIKSLTCRPSLWASM